MILSDDGDFDLDHYSSTTPTLALLCFMKINNTNKHRTAKCWNLGNDVPVYELKGHQQNVLCTLAVSNGLIITGSGDGSIKFWENGKNIRTIDAAHSCKCLINDWSH